MLDLVIRNVHIVTPTGLVWGSVAVKDEKIVGIVASDVLLPDVEKTIDGEGHFLLPGGVDPHVHIRWPAHPERETFETGSRAAASAGTTTLLEHPVSSPPNYNAEILYNRAQGVLNQSIVDVGFLGAAGGEHRDCMKELAYAGIYGYKTFLHEAPVGQEDAFEGLTSKDSYELQQVLAEAAKTGLLVAAHTEDNELVQGGIHALKQQGRCDPIAHCLSRPPLVEVVAVAKLLRIAKEVGARCYLVHVSVPEAVELALEARAKGQEVYIETCPHYLYRDESYLTRFGALAKNTPALRSREMADRLWHYVEDGSIDVIASDHGPYTLEEKTKHPEDIFLSPNGYAGVEIRLPAMLYAAATGRISLQRVVELCCTNPARIFGIEGKGAIKLGYDADFVLLDPSVIYPLDHRKFYTKSKASCKFMDGESVAGKIYKTILRGKVIFEEENFPVSPGYGRWLRRYTERTPHEI